MDLQATIDAQRSSGLIQLEAGVYAPQSSVYIPTDVILQGKGSKTKIVVRPGVSVICERGYNVTIRDLLIDADLQERNDMALVIKNPHDVMVERCFVINCGGFGIFPVSDEPWAGKVRVTNCRLSGKGNNDVLGGGPSVANSNMIDLIITGNFIRQEVNAERQYRAALDIVSMQSTIVVNNTIEGNLIMGGEKLPHANVIMKDNIVRPAIGAREGRIAVLTASNAGESDVSRHLSIEGNHVVGGHIFVQGQAQTSTRTQLVSIKDNHVKGVKTAEEEDYTRAISLNYVKDVIVDGNLIDGSAIGVYLNDAPDTRLGTNYFFNCSVESTTAPF